MFRHLSTGRPMIARAIPLLVGLGLCQTACSKKIETAAPVAAAPAAVTVAKVSVSEVAGWFEAGGIVQARTAATVTSRLLAPVREVRAVPGDRVRAGQVLIVLDGRDLEARARSARATTQAAGQGAAAAAAEQQAAAAALVLATATQGRIAALEVKRSATRQELDESTSALRAAEARVAGAAARAQEALSGVDSARAASDAADATESFALITAPFDGVVTEKIVEPGNMAAPGAPLMRLEDARGFRLDVRVDESRVGQIRPGGKVPVMLGAATDGATDGAMTTINGSVTEIARAVDADSRAFLVKITLPATAGLRSGTFGRARFGGQSRRALMVPVGATVRHGQVASVFVVENNVARLRLVNMQGTEVLAGLSDGETVIVNPPAGVVDGSRVSAGGR